MSEKVELVQLEPDDWQEYKALRLEALQNNPQAFGAKYTEVASWPDQHWRDFLLKKGLKQFARVDNQLVGMAGAYFSGDEGDKQKAHIWGVYTKPAYRGRGISRQILQLLLDDLSSAKDVESVELLVNTQQAVAVRLYHSLGFTIVEELQDALEHNGEKFNEYRMEKVLGK